MRSPPDRPRAARGGSQQSDYGTVLHAKHSAGAAQPEAPEYGESRRRFLLAMLMLNAIPTQRVVERIAPEVEAELARLPFCTVSG